MSASYAPDPLPDEPVSCFWCYQRISSDDAEWLPTSSGDEPFCPTHAAMLAGGDAE